MRFWGLLLLLLSVFALNAQTSANPFELQPRLTTEATSPTGDQDTAATNPFDLIREGQATAIDTASTNAPTNPFDVAVPNDPVTAPPPAVNSPPDTRETPQVTQDTPPLDSTLLLLTLLLVSALTLCVIFFRSVYQKAYRALFNDKLLSQLYREREAGAFGIFVITYSLFFLAAGLFLVLVLRHWGYLSLSDTLGKQYLYMTLAIAGLMIFKHLVLAIIGYIFPVQKEVSRYSFTIMLFSIVIGFFLVLSTTVLAYVPEESRNVVIYTSLGIVLLLYAVRLLQSILIANRFIFNYQFHFLSYICAVEIGPALCLFKILTDF